MFVAAINAHHYNSNSSSTIRRERSRAQTTAASSSTPLVSWLKNCKLSDVPIIEDRNLVLDLSSSKNLGSSPEKFQKLLNIISKRQLSCVGIQLPKNAVKTEGSSAPAQHNSNSLVLQFSDVIGYLLLHNEEAKLKHRSQQQKEAQSDSSGSFLSVLATSLFPVCGANNNMTAAKAPINGEDQASGPCLNGCIEYVQQARQGRGFISWMRSKDSVFNFLDRFLHFNMRGVVLVDKKNKKMNRSDSASDMSFPFGSKVPVNKPNHNNGEHRLLTIEMVLSFILMRIHEFLPTADKIDQQILRPEKKQKLVMARKTTNTRRILEWIRDKSMSDLPIIEENSSLPVGVINPKILVKYLVADAHAKKAKGSADHIERRASRESLQDELANANYKKFDILRRYLDRPVEELMQEVSSNNRVKMHSDRTYLLDGSEATLGQLLDAFKRHHTVYITKDGEIVASYNLARVLFQLMARF